MTYMTLKARLDRAGYILRKQGDGYLITDLRGLPVHETILTPYSQTIEDVQDWAEELAPRKRTPLRVALRGDPEPKRIRVGRIITT